MPLLDTDPLLGADSEAARAAALRRLLGQPAAALPGAVDSPPVIGDTQTAPNGMSITPVANPNPPSPQPGASSGQLTGLRDQVATINQLLGAAPQAPQVNHVMGGGQYLGPDRNGMSRYADSTVTADPSGLAQMQAYNRQMDARSTATQQLLGRLGTMGEEALRGGDLNLRSIMELGRPATGGQPRIPGGMELRANAVEPPSVARGAAVFQRDVQAWLDLHPRGSTADAHAAVAAAHGVSVEHLRRTIGTTTVGTNQSQLAGPLAGTGTGTPSPQTAEEIARAAALAGATNQPQTARSAFEDYVSRFAPQSPAPANGTAGPRLAANFNGLPMDQEANGSNGAGRLQHMRDFINSLSGTPALTSDIHNLVPILRSEFGASDETFRRLLSTAHAGDFFGSAGPSERAQVSLANAIRSRNPRAISNHNNLLGGGSYRVADNLDALLAPNADRELIGEGLSRGPGFLGIGGLDTTNPGRDSPRDRWNQLMRP